MNPETAQGNSALTTDVLVIGGGNAGLVAAISARDRGARVLVLESSPREFRGGNSRHTRNLRCMHDAPTSVLTETYTEDEYFADLLRVTNGRTDERLARMAVKASAVLPDWLATLGVKFQPSLTGALQLSRTNAFFLGGGKALLNSEYAAAQRRGVEIIYEAEVFELEVNDGRFCRARARVGSREISVSANSLVLAAGGFESNLEWLKEAWGAAADNFIVRGTPYNNGNVLKIMLKYGAQQVGDATQCHAVAIDARAPKFDGGIVTRLDCVSLGVVVNKFAQRFYDEGEDFWPKRYAIWGRLVAQQPDQAAYSIIDSKMIGRYMPSVYPPVRASSIRELARLLGLPPEQLEATIARYNAATRPGTFNHTVLDDCCTADLTPPKSHWAVPIDTPPFLAYPLRPGITFTYLGLKVDDTARVRMSDGAPAHNIFAAGEIMAGNILGEGYVAGVGMMIGTTFGRIAGTEAAMQGRPRS
ncbi:MAG: FAD-dependent tricarballylate dehydrogenase TcuA [Gammaproteobacteria bacterium]|nr:FAD-dependent tricarballylate dehydrogenase TcuA [Gammaproteobacteria bacterium]